MKYVGILITGGKAPAKDIYESFELNGLIAAADSGFDTAVNYGIQPDAVLGDLDSIQNIKALKNMPKEKIITFPQDKDYTDTELGLKWLWERGIEETVIVGGGGGRLDHIYGIFSLFDRDPYPQKWITDKYIVTTIDNRIDLEGYAGAMVSFFPVGTEICTFSTSGLKWPLDNLIWKKGDAGISNIIEKNKAHIAIKSGRIIMIHDIYSKGKIRKLS